MTITLTCHPLAFYKSWERTSGYREVVGHLLDIVRSVFRGVNLLPTRGQAFLLEGVGPVGRLGVVVDEVPAPAGGEPDGPAQRQGKLVFSVVCRYERTVLQIIID